MMMQSDPVIAKMLALVRAWEQAADQRAVFLRCYSMMTANMLAAIPEGQFRDPVWVNHLLHRFADYYFVALEAYEQEPQSAPVVWQMTHQASREAEVSALQKLLLGVNAHINYDLVFTLVDVLQPEWASLPETMREVRYADHCTVNWVIGQTIDAVQDQVLEPAMPWLEVADRTLGKTDELLISSLISTWREGVWKNAMKVMGAGESALRDQIIFEVEQDALSRAKAIARGHWASLLMELL